jgi:hypothetical protein
MTGRLAYDSTAAVIYAGGLHFVPSTDSWIANAIGGAAHGLVEDYVAKRTRFSVAGLYAKTAALRNGFDVMPKPGVVVHGKCPSIAVRGVYSTREAFKVFVQADGDMSATVGRRS